MAKDTAPQKHRTQAQLREDRLKAALKSNMARRKSQARARSVQGEGDTAGQAAPDPGQAGGQGETGNASDGAKQEG